VSNIGIALQLYTVRDAAAHDLPGTLRRCREAGFDYVQWSAMPDLPAPAIRDALDQAGLKAIAAHCAVEPLETDLAAVSAFWRTVGAPDLASGGMMSDCLDSIDAWRRGAARLDALCARLRGAGMRLSYHNHAFELERFAGDPRLKLDILYEETDATHLCAEFDTAWLAVGGADPAAYIRKYAGRCPLLHVKDLAPARDAPGRPVFTPLGQGMLDWAAVFDAAEEAAVEWYIYEQDACDGDVFDALRRSYEFLAAHA